MTGQDLLKHASNMRKTALKMAFDCGGNAHIGGGLSCIDVLAVLYGNVMNTANTNLSFQQRDKFIMSKGHGVLGLYAALAEFGILSVDVLSTFQQDGSDLIAHPVMKEEWGIEASSGSLGQGISMAVGLSLLAKKKGYSYRSYVICGNGECNEGSVWEAVMSAVQFQLDNLTLIIDNNHMQSDGESQAIMSVSDRYAEMLRSVGCDVAEVDGHDIPSLLDVFQNQEANGKPKAVVAHTIKGKSVSFMEGNNDWHHNRLTEKQYLMALEELEASESWK